MLSDGTPFKFNLIGARVLQNYCQDLIVPKIRELRPDFFGILLDSLPGHRPLIVRNNKYETYVLTFEELWN